MWERNADYMINSIQFNSKNIPRRFQEYHPGVKSFVKNPSLTMAPYLDPTNQAFIDAVGKAGGPPLWEQGYEGARATLERVQKHEPASGVTTTECDVPTKVSPAGKVKTVLYKLAGEQKGELPTVIYTHGGGWVLGR
jgi:acetyl esterase/lipase